MILPFLFVLYVAAIVAANVVTANEPPLTFDWLGEVWVVTWGTWFIALTFFLRDGIQLASSRAVAYGAIAVALVANVLLSLHYAETRRSLRAYANLLWITIASGLAFATSEVLERVGRRVAVSGVFGGTLDSIVFAVVGLSPLTTGIVPWEFLWTTVVAQVVVKTGASLVAGATLAAAEQNAAEARA